MAPAVTYNGKRMPINRPPPWLSQHTDEVRRKYGLDAASADPASPQILRDELGYTSDRIASLRDRMIV